MRNAESRRGHEEKPPESGKRRKAEQPEPTIEAREVSPADRFEVEADNYNDIRDTISEKRSELKNLKLNELTKGDKLAQKALEGDIENYESQAVVIEKSYGSKSNQFVTDAGRLKDIRTEMDLATRKMGAIERVMKRGEFPGGEDAAKAEMDAQAARITRADRELKALKGMYATEEAAPASGPSKVTAETKPKSRKKNDHWMTNAQPGKKPVDAASAKETDDAVAMAMEMSAEKAKKQEDAEYADVEDSEITFVDAAKDDLDIPVTVEHYDTTETDRAVADAIKMSAETIQTEPIPLLTETQKLDAELNAAFGNAEAKNAGTMNELDREELAALKEEMEFQRGAMARLESELREKHGVKDELKATSRGFFSRLFSGMSAKGRALDQYNEASMKYAEAQGKLDEAKNRMKDPAKFAEARRVGGDSKLGNQGSAKKQAPRVL